MVPQKAPTQRRVRLTVAMIEKTKPPRTGRRELWDSVVPGFALRVTSTGARAFQWFGRIRGRGPARVRVTLGPVPGLSLEKGRELARAAMLAALRGEDPRDERRQRRAAAHRTFKAVADEYLERRVRREQQLRTADEIEARIKNHVLKAWGSRPISAITRADVRERLDALVDAGMGTGANRLLSHLSALFKWAAERDYVTVPPTFGVRAPIPERRRDRVLSEDEIATVWNAAGTLGTFGRFVRMLLATAQRRTVVARMTWDELDLKAATWTVPPEPGSKSRRTWLVPLNATARAILAECPRIAGSPHVFPSRVRRSHLSGFKSGKAKLDALTKEIPAWRLHDLRRTAASNMTAAGVPRLVVEKVLEHADGTLAAVYDRFDYFEPKVEALAKWSARLEAIIENANGKKHGQNGQNPVPPKRRTGAKATRP